MEYTEEKLDQTTGDLVTVSLGDWVTVTEFGAARGLGQRQIREALVHLGIMAIEDETGVSGKTKVSRRRLTSEAVEDGLGKRLYPKKKGRYPFDVLSPKGQSWVDERLSQALRELHHRKAADPVVLEAEAALKAFKERRRRPDDITLQMEVVWLMDAFPSLTQVQIESITGASKQAVSKYATIRSDGRSFWLAYKAKELPAVTSGDHGQPLSSLTEGFTRHEPGVAPAS